MWQVCGHERLTFSHFNSHSEYHKFFTYFKCRRYLDTLTWGSLCFFPLILSIFRWKIAFIPHLYIRFLHLLLVKPAVFLATRRRLLWKKAYWQEEYSRKISNSEKIPIDQWNCLILFLYLFQVVGKGVQCVSMIKKPNSKTHKEKYEGKYKTNGGRLELVWLTMASGNFSEMLQI